jgi:PAS domain-containing protein
MNATDDSFGGFFYSTAPSGNESVISVAANKAMIDSAPFTSIGYVKFADRVLKITIIPSDAYINLYNTYIKWVALVLCLCFMMVLLVVCVFIYFLRKLMVARKGRLNAELQIDLLRTNQSSLRSLLERIATQEQKQRSTINAFPDYVCVVSDSGKLLQTNAAFDADFPFSQMELERGVYTFAIFTELASDFYRTAGENEIVTQAARRFGDYMDVKVRVRSLGHDSNKDSSSLSNEFKSKTGPTSNLSSSSVQVIEEEAYLIIAKNITEKKEDSIVDERARHARSELEKKFRDPKFRSELRAFCEREKNVENVLFLEAVREYKKTPFAERVNMKDSIFEKFIKRGAMLQLNLANDVIVEETIKISKCIADVDVFKTVEECVFKTLEDVYPRFQMERKSSTASTASLSSSE